VSAWLLRPLCWLLAVVTLGILGHRWKVTRMHMGRSLMFGAMHPLAGCDAVCERCSASWLDAEPV
jgi:hypothetical protein